MRRVALVLALGAAACSARPPAPRADASAPVPLPDAEAAPPLSGSVMTWLGPGELEISATGRFESALRVERRGDDGKWRPVEQADPLLLRPSCEGPIPAPCIELTLDTPMRPARWNGLALNAQCGLGARGIGGDVAGSIRMVLSRCDGGVASVSPPFEAWSEESAGARSWAAGSMQSARVARLEHTHSGDPKAAPTADRRAGDRVRSGSEQELDATARTELSALLADHRGYSERLVRRCAPGPRVGFRVTRALPSNGTALRSQELDLAVDLSCGTLAVAYGESAPRRVRFAVFDAVRPRWVAFGKQLFPDDPEIARVPSL